MRLPRRVDTEVQEEGLVRRGEEGGRGDIEDAGRAHGRRRDSGGSACADHIHMCLRIAPKYAVSSVVGKLKGRSAIVLHERHPEWRGITGRDRTLWARGHCVSTIGLDEAKVRKYVREQEEASRTG